MSTRFQSPSINAGGSSLTVRPGATYSSAQRAHHQPYPAPGTSGSRHGPANGRHAASTSAAHANLGGRALARERWAAHFGGPHYLDPGVNNRLVLSLRSGLPVEIDFALERLVQVSGTDPDLLRLPDFPGLAEALAGLVRFYLDLRISQHATVRAHINALAVDHERETWRRRAMEATLVLRNMALERTNLKLLQVFKKLPLLVADVLEEGSREGPDGDEMTELRVHMLETLEVVADHVPLTLPGYAIASSKDATGEGTESRRSPEPASSPAVRLFPLLVALTRSTDRALVVSSFRCLTALSQNEKSEPVFALFSYNEHAPLPKPHPHPIDTAVELLPVADADLSAAVLDFIYQHTLIPSNAIAFCARPDLLGILPLVCTKFHCGARKEIVEVPLPVKGSSADEWQRKLPPRHRARSTVKVTKGVTTTELEPEESAKLRVLGEPERTLTWMRLVFESDPEASITQVAFWTAYRAEFERPIPSVPTSAPLLPAAEVIRLSTEAYPSAMPMVHQEGSERKFIIRGLKIRDRTDLSKVFGCRWTGCSTPTGFKSGAALYGHLHHHHIASARPARCAWAKCDYTSTHDDSTAAKNDLSLHVRVHVPTYDQTAMTASLPSLNPSHTSQPRPTPTAALSDPPTSIMHHRYHALLDEGGEPAGLGFLACIVVRNVARVIKLSLGSAAGGASVHSLSGPGATSIFEQIAAAQENGGGKAAARESVWARLEKHNFADASGGAEALMAIETKLISTTSEDHGLGKILGEVLDVVTSCRKVAAGQKASKDAGDAMESGA